MSREKPRGLLRSHKVISSTVVPWPKLVMRSFRIRDPGTQLSTSNKGIRMKVMCQRPHPRSSHTPEIMPLSLYPIRIISHCTGECGNRYIPTKCQQPSSPEDAMVV